MIFPHFAAGLVAALSINGVYAGPCRPSTKTTAIASSETTAVTTSGATVATTSDTTAAETSSAASTVLTSEISSSETTSAATSDTTTAETSFATSTILTTSGLDFTTDLTTFITLTADTTTSDFASTTSAFVPADLFPCTEASDCLLDTKFCDSIRCGCFGGFCRQLTDTTTAPATATSAVTSEATSSAPATTTTFALPELYCTMNIECDDKTIDGADCMLSTCRCVENMCVVEEIVTE